MFKNGAKQVQEVWDDWVLMLPVSPVFNTVVTMSIGLINILGVGTSIP